MLWRILCVALLLVGPSALRAQESFTFVAIGCLPYSRVPDADLRADALRDEINRRGPAFTVHCGDINGGGELADNARYAKIREWFDTFEAPLLYTPGDNEWTDAHRPAIGGFEPTERLATLREYFFAQPESRGQQRLALETQASAEGYARFVENNRWTHQGVVFATVHVVGSRNNNQPSIPGAVAEYTERDAANIAWLRSTFAAAVASEAPAVVLFMQAQPFAWNRGREGFISGFEAFLRALEAECRAFNRPVLLVHADEHVYRFDAAIPIAQGEAPIPNLSRLSTFGDRDLHGVEVLVDPTVDRVFAPGPLIVPGQPRPGLRR